MTATTDLADNLDERCWSARDVLTLVGALRQAKVRDPLRELENHLLDLVGEA